MNYFGNISPLDHRYRASDPALWEALSATLSEEGYQQYLMKVEWALVQALENRGVCEKGAADEVRDACREISMAHVQAEEEKTRHNIRALVNCIRNRVSESVRPYIHLTATSSDVLDTARALQVKDAVQSILLPKLEELLQVLVELAKREAYTPTVGRTHGQHGVPITFGFAMAEYVSRLGRRIEHIRWASQNVRGKMAGAVGAYNASSLFFDDPDQFEQEVLALIDLKPGQHSTQIVEPEYMLDLYHTLISAFGVLANFADDMRHLQRTEIDEVGERFAPGQVGSSTMPHKRNPWNFEHVKSMWKVFMPRMTTIYMDQISEHQRDLTNSASGRFMPEIIAGLTLSTNRLIKVTGKLSVAREHMRANLDIHGQMIMAEPLYIILSSYGHPDAHEAVRRLTLSAQETGEGVAELAWKDPDLKPYLERLTAAQKKILDNPANYIGIAAQKCLRICAEWEQAE